MKRLRLSDVLKSRTFQKSTTEFGKSAVRNPFDKQGMDDFVRNRGAKQGLDRVSRAHTGKDSGVNASRYDDLVRDFNGRDVEHKDSGDTTGVRRSGIDFAAHIVNDKDDLYLTGKDRSYRQNEFNQPEDINDIDVDAGWAFMRELSDLYDEQAPEDEEGEEGPEGNFGGARYDGVVRTVKGAYLVSKDKAPDATFTEVWIYNVGDKYEEEANIRKSILAATDIDPSKNFSEDGSQEAHLKTVGNVQFLTITGLPD